MLNYIYEYILNNIFYIIPIMGIFTTLAINNTKARTMVIFLASSVLLVALLFIFNKYSINNDDFRSMLVAIITTYCDAFQIIVHGFLLYLHILQLGLALGIVDLLYGFTMGNVILTFIYYFHMTFNVKLRRVNLYVKTILNAKFAYLKKIIFNRHQSSFLQVLRV